MDIPSATLPGFFLPLPAHTNARRNFVMPLILSQQTPPITTHHHRRRSPATIPLCLTNFRPVLHSHKPFTMLSPPHQITAPTFSRTTVICMANPRRVKMVARQIQREISNMLLSDNVLKSAVLPEAALGADRYLSSITTISDVEISNDLQVVKVYVSYFGDERGKELAISGLKAKAKYVRAQLGRRMSLRLTPEVRFFEDNSIEEGSKVLAIIRELQNERKAAKSQAGKRGPSDIDEEDEDEYEDEDEDENEIVDEDQKEDEDEDEDEDDDDNWEDEHPDKGGIIYVD